MVHENHHWAGARWCMKTTIGWVHDGVEKSPWGSGKTTVGRVRDGVRKPQLDRSVMVYEDYHLVGAQWCTKTMVGQVLEGAQKQSLASSSIVSKNHSGADA